MPPTHEDLPIITLPPKSLSSFIKEHPDSDLNSNSTSTPKETHTEYPNTTPDEALNMHTRRNNNVTVTKTTKPTLMTRLKGRNAASRTTKTTTEVHHTGPTHTHATRSSRWGSSRRTAQPVVHHKRHATIGDKISGGLMKLKGSLTRRPGVKAAGTRRMHGTDGRGSHRVY